MTGVLSGDRYADSPIHVACAPTPTSASLPISILEPRLEVNSEQKRHSDVTCVEVPPTFSFLFGNQPLEMEGVDDDTSFANIHKAYEQLSPGMKAFLGRTSAVLFSLCSGFV